VPTPPADGRDATIAIINLAGLVHAHNEIDSAFGMFSPTREMVGSGPPGLTPTGKYDSNRAIRDYTRR
jgi:hypothetical protein